MFDPVRLNEILTLFYFGASRQDGEHYKATSFENMSHALNGYLHSLLFIRDIDIIKGDDFRDAKVSFRAYLAELKRIGKGYVEYHSAINKSDRRKLYNSKHMSPNTPFGSQNKVQFDITLYFCRRLVENMHAMYRSTF